MRQSECILRNFAEGCALGDVVDTSESCAAMQRALNKVEKWTDKNYMKCSVLYLERKQPHELIKTGANWLEISRKGLQGP